MAENSLRTFAARFPQKKLRVLNMAPHGGACCGMSHLFNFMSMGIDEKEILEVIGERTRDIERDAETEYGEYDEYDEFIPGTVPWEVFGHAVEVVLTDDQMPDFGPKLKKAGFKHVFRWLNDNSGNYCNLLVYKSSDEDENNPPDFNWEEM